MARDRRKMMDASKRVYAQCAAIADALLKKFPSASDGVAHVVIGDNNFDEEFLAEPIGEIEMTLAWRSLLTTQNAPTTLVEFPSKELVTVFRRNFGNYPGDNSRKSDAELAAILGALQLMQWLWEQAR